MNSQLEAFYLPPPSFQSFRGGSFIGDTRQGGSVNCEMVSFYPHGNGTHTECVGHISKRRVSVEEIFSKQASLIPSMLITVEPEEIGKTKDSYSAKHLETDLVISRRLLEQCFEKILKTSHPNNRSIPSEFFNALIIRTLPNENEKKFKVWSGTNPPYLTEDAMKYLVESNVHHLLVDLPSVDRENDEGKVMAHSIFFNFDKLSEDLTTETISFLQTCSKNSITELCFIPNSIEDGLYLLNLQIAPFYLDAAPSKPILFPLITKKN